MKAVFGQNKIAPTICSPEEYPESWRGEVLTEKLDDAHSCLTLHLTNNVLREIDEKDNIWIYKKENKSHGENLYVRGRVDRRESLSHRSKSKRRSKSQEKNKVKWFYCGKESHIKKQVF
ncbi:hypothetical protein M9H77_06118 [Catharanthus roseus]|uniref:Uncharacterized protein n=1 Tax=Catharanthus roseus TaxID=4058 RepID=A0ACC0BRD2_CATRO|nr:hypothetical protein M9H77_06118 [Catharanthus roseus]